jgi:hypothetical protein
MIAIHHRAGVSRWSYLTWRYRVVYHRSFVMTIACMAFGSNSAAEILQTQIVGTVTSVYAGIDPLWDPIEPPPVLPEADPAFAERFMPGQRIVINYRFDSSAMDQNPANDTGSYPALISGQFAVSGSKFNLFEGDIRIILDNPTGNDRFAFGASGFEAITDPIAGTGTILNFAIEATSLFQNDSLPPVPPASWTNSFGHFRVIVDEPGLLYMVQFEVDDIYNIPEPSSLVTLTAACFFRMLFVRLTRRV